MDMTSGVMQLVIFKKKVKPITLQFNSDSNQLEEIRRMTGICPQHDVLFDLLTPVEHLAFYAKIRVRRTNLT